MSGGNEIGGGPFGGRTATTPPSEPRETLNQCRVCDAFRDEVRRLALAESLSHEERLLAIERMTRPSTTSRAAGNGGVSKGCCDASAYQSREARDE